MTAKQNDLMTNNFYTLIFNSLQKEIILKYYHFLRIDNHAQRKHSHHRRRTQDV